MVTELQAGQPRLWFSVRATTFRQRVQTGSGAHPASYPAGTWGTYTEGKAAGVWSWQLTSI